MKRSKYFNNNELENDLKIFKSNNNNSNNDDLSKRLNQDYFDQHTTIELARSLLGKYLCRRINDDTIIRGMIVETEAYLGPEDHASYSYNNHRTVANEPMYMIGGTCFIRLLYGMYYCFNLSSNDHGGAVLIRAIEPDQNSIDKMIEIRANHSKASKNLREKLRKKPIDLCNGPAKLCIAFDIDHTFNCKNITEDQTIWLEHNGINYESSDIIESQRIGINPKNLWSSKLLRFYLRSNRYVSKF